MDATLHMGAPGHSIHDVVTAELQHMRSFLCAWGEMLDTTLERHMPSASESEQQRFAECFKVWQAQPIGNMRKQQETEVCAPVFAVQEHWRHTYPGNPKCDGELHALLQKIGGMLEDMPASVAEKVEGLLKHAQASDIVVESHPVQFHLPGDIPVRSQSPSRSEGFRVATPELVSRVHSSKSKRTHATHATLRSPTAKPQERQESFTSGAFSTGTDICALNSARGWAPLRRSRANSGGLETTQDRVKLLSKWLDWVSMVLIVLNSIFLGIEAEVRLTATISERSTPAWLWYVNVAFAIIFSLELIVKAVLLRGDFCRKQRGWNVFDLLLVMSSIADLVFEFLNMTFLRSARIFRALRAARVMRTIGYVHELRLMVASILSSLPSLFWAFLLLMLLLFLFALMIMAGVEGHFQTFGVDGALVELYGSLGSAIETLFMSISGGVDWKECVLPLREVSWMFVPLFFVFIVFVVFGVLNILTAVFIDASSRILDVDRDLVVQQKMVEESSTINQLTKLFREADVDNTGKITIEEIDKVFGKRESAAILRTFGLDGAQARSFFQILDIDTSNEVDIEEFVSGLMRLRGWAKGVDVATIMYENKRLFTRLKRFTMDVDSNFRSLSRALDTVEQLARQGTSTVHFRELHVPTTGEEVQDDGPVHQPQASWAGGPAGVLYN